MKRHHAHTRYLKRVRFLRYFLPMSVALILCVVFFWPQISSHWIKTSAPPVEASLTWPEITDNRLMTPSYASLDDDGRPYEVGANWAIQRDKSTMELSAPQGSITMKDDEVFKLEAKEGLYSHDHKTLHLEGDVTLESNKGQHLETQDVEVDLEHKSLQSHTPVQGESFGGKLSAQEGFEVDSSKGHRRLVLKGKSKVTLRPNALKKGMKP